MLKVKYKEDIPPTYTGLASVTFRWRGVAWYIDGQEQRDMGHSNIYGGVWLVVGDTNKHYRRTEAALLPKAYQRDLLIKHSKDPAKLKVIVNALNLW